MLGTKENPIQILILGDSGVGKSCLIHRIIHKNFDYKMTSTQLLTKLNHKFYIDNLEIFVTFIDFPGWEDDPKYIKSYIKGSHIVLFLSEFGHKKSFENLKEKWYYYATEVLDNNFVGCVVTTKIDLLISEYPETFDASRFAESQGYDFVSISTEKEIKTKGLFEGLIVKLLRKKSGQ